MEHNLISSFVMSQHGMDGTQLGLRKITSKRHSLALFMATWL